MGLNHQQTKRINKASDNMDERIKQQGNEWVVKLTMEIYCSIDSQIRNMQMLRKECKINGG